MHLSKVALTVELQVQEYNFWNDKKGFEGW